MQKTFEDYKNQVDSLNKNAMTKQNEIIQLQSQLSTKQSTISDL